MLQAGIVGLPNVGKSTLFNALTKTRKAEAANYPFCTIDPNVGVVQVPDNRLQPLANLVGTSTIIPAAIEMVDIAGLVAGASKGEGLGNKFLANVREVDAIVHVVRCFEDEDIIHNMGRVDPIGDAEIIMTELILADVESTQGQLQKNLKKIKKTTKFGANLGGKTEAKIIKNRLNLPTNTKSISTVPFYQSPLFGPKAMISGTKDVPRFQPRLGPQPISLSPKDNQN